MLQDESPAVPFYTSPFSVPYFPAIERMSRYGKCGFPNENAGAGKLPG